MDSAMRTGVQVTFSVFEPEYHRKIFDYVDPKTGICVRCPISIYLKDPSNNPKNFTRDQMMCLVAGLASTNNLGIWLNRKVLKATAKRFFFAQNKERDLPGSKKYPWKHTFHEDSDRNKPLVTKNFDWADPLLPSHISHLISCSKLYWAYPFHIVGWSMLVLQIIFNSRKIYAEQNQLQCMVKIAGPPFVWLYKLCSPKWKEQTTLYWNVRCESEYAALIIKGL